MRGSTYLGRSLPLTRYFHKGGVFTCKRLCVMLFEVFLGETTREVT